jgi:hypothetical protein
MKRPDVNITPSERAGRIVPWWHRIAEVGHGRKTGELLHGGPIETISPTASDAAAPATATRMTTTTIFLRLYLAIGVILLFALFLAMLLR